MQVNAGPAAWANLHPEAIHRSREEIEEGASTLTLRMGDFMYLPPSYIHEVLQ